METSRLLRTAAIALMMVSGPASLAGTIRFSGYEWTVRSSGRGGPGPNNWDPENVSVDTNGWLHLKLTRRDDKWYCSEVYTQKRLGFGCYQFWLSGRVDRLDRNVVLGLFNYPTSDVGPDGTHEIDIEFAQWGNPSAPMGNYTVWPATLAVKRETKSFSFVLNADLSIHSFIWSPTNLLFQSQAELSDGNRRQFATWLYQPPDPTNRIAQKPMPLHLNLWCFSGRPPSDGQPVEVVIRAFKFTPLPASAFGRGDSP